MSHPLPSVLNVEALEPRYALDARSFVTGVYNDLLNRAPDTAGLNFWVDQIQRGTSNEQVATGIWRSLEHRRLQVDEYYRDILKRNADAGGRDFWANRLGSGLNDELGVQLGLLTSTEYINSHNTPNAYVSGLFLDVLGRAASTVEQNFWLNILQTRGAVFTAGSILTSTESYLIIIDDYFDDFLNRNPDTAGQADWLARLQTGRVNVERFGEGVLGSAEYASKN